MSKLLEKINTTPRTTIKLANATSRIGDGLHGTPIYNDNGEYYFINGNNLDNGYISIKKDTKKVDESEFIKHKKDLNEHTLLLSINGTIGNLARYRGEKCILGKSASYINIKDGFNSDYFYYVLLDDRFKKHITNNASGSTIKNVSLEQLREYEIDIPDLSVQKKIAEVLSAYDAKIENNNLIIKKLEATAQALFDEWFVNFRFPGYEKARFVDSKMGEIPEGWEVRPLDQIADFLNGVASQKYPAINKTDSLPVIKIREMNLGIDQNSDRATREIDKKYIIKNGDILFAWSGSLSLMTWFGGEGVLNQHIFKVTSETYPKWFIYHWVQRHLPNFKIIAEGKATTMGHIQRHHLSESLVIVPAEPILIKANKILSNLFDQQILLQEENISLKSQRDQLLAKLI